MPDVPTAATGRAANTPPRTIPLDLLWTAAGHRSLGHQRDRLRDLQPSAVKDAPRGHGPHKTFYTRFVRWSRLGVFDCIFNTLAAQAGVPQPLMIDSTHLKAYRAAASLAKKALLHAASNLPTAG